MRALGYIVIIVAMLAIPVSIAVYQDSEAADSLLQKIGLPNDTGKAPIETPLAFDTAKIEQRIFELTNEERLMAGLNPLRYDEGIADVAAYHSKDMADNNYYDHVSPDGESLRARLSQFNVRCSAAGENINQGGSYYGDYTNEMMADNAVSSWMDSQGHRDNILSPMYSRIGVGVEFNSLGNVAYLTQNFC